MWNDNEIKIHRNILEVAYIQKKRVKFLNIILMLLIIIGGKDNK